MSGKILYLLQHNFLKQCYFGAALASAFIPNLIFIYESASFALLDYTRIEAIVRSLNK